MLKRYQNSPINPNSDGTRAEEVGTGRPTPSLFVQRMRGVTATKGDVDRPWRRRQEMVGAEGGYKWDKERKERKKGRKLSYEAMRGEEMWLGSATCEGQE